MSDPIVVACPQKVWVSLATNVTTGQVILLEPRANYKITYRDTGNPAPVGEADAENAPKIQTLSVDIDSLTPIDVYIWAVEGLDGSVTVYT